MEVECSSVDNAKSNLEIPLQSDEFPRDTPCIVHPVKVECSRALITLIKEGSPIACVSFSPPRVFKSATRRRPFHLRAAFKPPFPQRGRGCRYDASTDVSGAGNIIGRAEFGARREEEEGALSRSR